MPDDERQETVEADGPKVTVDLPRNLWLTAERMAAQDGITPMQSLQRSVSADLLRHALGAEVVVADDVAPGSETVTPPHREAIGPWERVLMAAMFTSPVLATVAGALALLHSDVHPLTAADVEALAVALLAASQSVTTAALAMTHFYFPNRRYKG